MKLKWNADRNTLYWAKRCNIVESDSPLSQYDGLRYPSRKRTALKYISDVTFPEYCDYPQQSDAILASPENIIHCFHERKYLEGLALVLSWGRMQRKRPNIYTKPHSDIEQIITQCFDSIQETRCIKVSWNTLTEDLKWSPVIASKCLHFVARSLNYNENPPVPIDNAVILQNVWPKFEKAITDVRRTTSDPPVCQNWEDTSDSWNAYNRYMTAIIVWANDRGWTTTQLENTIFAENRKTKKHSPSVGNNSRNRRSGNLTENERYEAVIGHFRKHPNKWFTNYEIGGIFKDMLARSDYASRYTRRGSDEDHLLDKDDTQKPYRYKWRS